MMKPNAMTSMVLAAGMLLAGLCTGPTSAQETTSDLARQNQQLTDRIQDLERQLKAANDRVKQLEQQLASAKAGGATSAAPANDKVTVDESIPTASPRALLRAMAASYEKDPAKLDMGRGGDPKRKAYLRRLEGWKGMVDREFRSPITWHVRLVGQGDPPFANGSEVFRFVAVDPMTDVELGPPFDLELSRLVTDRLRHLQERDELDVLVLRGALSPAVRINQDRATRGSFDNPPFIGPFAELAYSINVQSLVPVKESADNAPATKAESKPAPKPSAAAPKPSPAAANTSGDTRKPAEKP